MAPDVELAIAQFPLLNGPTPSASGVVAAGDTEVNVTATLPAVVTEKVNVTEPFGASGPLNVSVVDVAVVGAVVELPPPNRLPSGLTQADRIATDAESRSDRNSCRTVIPTVVGLCECAE